MTVDGTSSLLSFRELKNFLVPIEKLSSHLTNKNDIMRIAHVDAFASASLNGILGVAEIIHVQLREIPCDHTKKLMFSCMEKDKTLLTQIGWTVGFLPVKSSWIIFCAAGVRVKPQTWTTSCALNLSMPLSHLSTGPLETEETDFGQSRFGHPDLTNFGQSNLGQFIFGHLGLARPILAKTNSSQCNFGQSHFGQSNFGFGVCHGGAQTQKKTDPEGWGPEGWGRRGGGPKISRFFSLSRSHVRSFFSLGGPFVEFWGCLEAPEL